MYNTCLCINSTQVHIYVCMLFYWLVHHKKKRKKKIDSDFYHYRGDKNIGENYTLLSKILPMIN